MLSAALALTDDIEVVGTAMDPLIAREQIKLLNPDVLTLDVEMPKMDGISFLSNLMRLRPMPVVMVSTMTTKGSEVTFDALELGAVDYIPKPNANLKGDLTEFTKEVQDKIRAAASAHVMPLSDWKRSRIANKKKHVLAEESGIKTTFSYIIAIGASTGGTEAIKTVLLDLPASCPPIVITQHMPPGFSASFAKRLDKTCSIRVVEAKNNQPINSGTAYLAPGDHHLTIQGKPGHFTCKLDQDPKVNLHRPSVDVLFDSVRNRAGGNAIGVLLTGMGADGAEGLLRMRKAGSYTIAQNEASSVVWGMPGSAVRLLANDDLLALDKIAVKLMKAPSTGKSAAHFNINT
jgi:two-component system chemotaxis response regulator CheB